MLATIAGGFGIALAFSSMMLSWYCLTPRDPREKSGG